MELENFVSLLLFENVVLSHSHSHFFPFESDKTAHNACFFAKEGHSNTARWACTAETNFCHIHSIESEKQNQLSLINRNEQIDYLDKHHYPSKTTTGSSHNHDKLNA